MTNSKLPKYRKQASPHGARAFVQLGERRVYLGAYGTPESQELYRRTVAQWLESGQSPVQAGEVLRISELAFKFWTFAEGFYRKPDGTKTSSIDNYRIALRPLKRLYGSVFVSEFGPLCLKAVRADLVAGGLSRPVVNKMVNLVRRVFKWGVAEQLVPESVWRSLQAVEGLRIGRSEAGEPEPVRPVPDREIEAIKPHVSRQVWALIQLQLLTGARPGELLVLRPIDLDTGGGKVWTSKPAYHKTAWHGHGRTIYFGPEAQKILKQFMPRQADGSSRTDAYLFSPAEAEQERLAALHARRLTPMNQGNKPGSNRVDDPETSPRDRYDIASYRRAIARACLRVHPLPAKLRRQKDEKLEDYRKRMAGPDGAEVRTWRREHCWHPHQLRHNAATRLRREFGIDLAQTILGHRVGSAITEIYTEANVAKAIEVVAKIG